MKVNKIKKIENFGQLDDFNWPENLSEFKSYNFFYGWNYSGKTTLSRIFRCFEKKQLHKDYQNAKFSFVVDDNQTLTEEDINSDYSIRVFNEDFIEDNFDWNNENAEIEPVLILGEESKELEKQLKERESGKKEKEKQKEEKKREKQQKERELQDKLTSKASEIRNILSITNPRQFDKNQLENQINQIKNNYLENILSDEKLEALRTLIISPKLDPIDTPSLPKTKLNKFIHDISNILNKRVTVQQVIEKLKENPRLSQWVKDGIELHKEETTCQFCGNPLSKERLEELNKHFSKEFDNLMETIKQTENELDWHINSINQISFPDEARFYNEFKQSYKEKLNKIEEIKQKYIDTISNLKKELARKKEKPFELIDLDKSITNGAEEELNNAFKDILEIINEHNDKVKSIDKEKEEAKEKIKLHYCAKFIQDEEYFKKLDEINQLNEKIQNLYSEINFIQQEIKQIEQKIKASAIGAKRINDYLNKFFGDDRLKIELTENGTYKLYRNNQIAKNLSTGEKNIISLIYFFAKLEETNFDTGSALIFIDDPVSSLDANHMHRVYSFLSKKVQQIGQLFITTHNFDFFNLLKDMYKYDLRNDNGNFYLIKKINNKNECCSTIENLPNLLLKFKSEYNYLFSILKEFNESDDKSNFNQLFLLPNVLRRFFEMYLFMKYPDGRKFKDKVNKFLTNDSTEKKTVLKIMDEYSHEENIEHSLRFPDIQELITAIEFILNELKEKDKNHYDALCQSLEPDET